MKNRLTIFLMFLSMILTISCAKDYNALFNERVAELNKEGKYILNQYNDSVGKEHYIVYIDADKIVVDTLGDSLQVYPLGKVETYQYLPNVDFNDGKFSLERYNSTDCTIKADTAKKQIMVSDDIFYPKGKIVKFSELKAHKRDYVLIPTEQKNIIVLNNKVTTKKRNAERYSDRIELQGFQSCFRLFVKPSQSPLKPNQDAATLLVRNHARNGDKRTRITKQGVKD